MVIHKEIKKEEKESDSAFLEISENADLQVLEFAEEILELNAASLAEKRTMVRAELFDHQLWLIRELERQTEKKCERNLYLRDLLVIKEIVVKSDRVHGVIPEGIGLLENLEVLNLAYSRGITGEIPDSISKLKKLKVLNVKETGLSGKLPESIEKLPNLGCMSISLTGLTGSLSVEFLYRVRLEMESVQVGINSIVMSGEGNFSGEHFFYNFKGKDRMEILVKNKEPVYYPFGPAEHPLSFGLHLEMGTPSGPACFMHFFGGHLFTIYEVTSGQCVYHGDFNELIVLKHTAGNIGYKIILNGAYQNARMIHTVYVEVGRCFL